MRMTRKALDALIERAEKEGGRETFEALAEFVQQGDGALHERALECVFDRATAGDEDAKAVQGELLDEGYWLTRDGTQLACFLRVVKEGHPRAVQALVNLADEGNEEAMKEVRRMEERVTPRRHLTTANAERSVVRAMVGEKRLYSQYVIQRDMDALRKELAGESPTPLELILVDRVVLCQLALGWEEMSAAQTSGMTFKQSDHVQKKIDQAHRRLLGACESLARVRRLQISPTLQVNIGQKQLNVAAPGEAVSQAVMPDEQASRGGAEPHALEPPKPVAVPRQKLERVTLEEADEIVTGTGRNAYAGKAMAEGIRER